MEDYKVYLFDMDGTLVNSEPLKGKALAAACSDYNSAVDFNIYKDVMGESWSVVAGYFFCAANIHPPLSEFNVHFRKHYEALLKDNLELNRGVKTYIQKLKSDGKQCGIVSSAATWMVEYILDMLGLENEFDVIITQDHVSAHKPDPEAYNLALSKFGVLPSQAIVFEDSTAGIQAGLACGCKVIAVAHEFNGKNDLSGAVKLIGSYEEMYA